MRFGPEALSTLELLAIVMRVGTRGENVVNLAGQIFHAFGGLRELVRVTHEELARIKGVGSAKAAQIMAAIELGRRAASLECEVRAKVGSAKDVAELLMPKMRYLDREHFKAVLLDTKNQVVGLVTVSVGSLDSALVHPRELFKESIKRGSAALVLAHNHPSGDPTPSSEDVTLTKRIIRAGEILGIEVLDHVIIGDNRFVSLKDKGLLGV